MGCNTLGSVLFAVLAGMLGVALAEEGNAPTRKRSVYAWFPKDYNDWNTRAIDWSAITHIAYRSAVIEPDGTLKEARSRAQVKQLLDEAHKHGVKVSVLVWGTNSQGSSTYLARNADKAVQSIVGYAKAMNLDALDMDDETWRAKNTVTGGPNRDLITAFFRKLRGAARAWNPRFQIYYASPPVISAQDKYGRSWMDYKAIAEHIDGFCIMSYTMNPPRIGWSTSAQPVNGGGKVGPHPRDYETCVKDYLEATGGRKDKLLLGIDPSRGGVEYGNCRGSEPLSGCSGGRKLSAQEARANARKHGRLFHPLQKVPWYRYQTGGTWVQGFYEDEESFAAKYELVRKYDLQGVCLWVLDGSNQPPDTFREINKYLHGKE